MVDVLLEVALVLCIYLVEVSVALLGFCELEVERENLLCNTAVNLVDVVTVVQPVVDVVHCLLNL